MTCSPWPSPCRRTSNVPPVRSPWTPPLPIVVRSFDAHGISNILLKGPAIRHWLYPDDPAGRTYTDVDLLVSPSKFIAAERVLKDLGFRRPVSAYRDRTYAWDLGSTWVHPTVAAPISIDLHRGFHGVTDWEAFWTVMDANTTVIEVAGAPVRIPAAAGCALISALHASASSGAEHSAADLKRASDGLGEEVWREAASHAEDAGVLPSFRLGLSRHEEGRLLLDTLQIAGDLPADEATFFLATLDADAERVAGAWWLQHLWSPAAGLRNRARVLIDVLFPSADYLRDKNPIARRGRLGLAMARLARPVTLAVRAPGILWLVLRGRWRARQSRRAGDPK